MLSRRASSLRPPRSQTEQPQFFNRLFGARERIYSVCYRNSEGETKDVHCKTSMWSGVYFTDEG